MKEPEYIEDHIPSAPDQIKRSECMKLFKRLYGYAEYRLDLFFGIAPRLKGAAYWEILRYVYTTVPNLFLYKERIKEAFMSREPERNRMMTFNERMTLKELPGMVKLYRGMSIQERESGDFGFSWALSYSTADYFARNRTHTQTHIELLGKTVHEVQVKKKDIIALFAFDEYDFEVIYLGGNECALTIPEWEEKQIEEHLQSIEDNS